MNARKAQPGAARTQSYRAAAEQLAQIAAELEGGETDLDKVLLLLNQAQAAYAVCKERIDALRSALDEDGERTLPSSPAQEDAEDADADADSDDDLYF
ncbi:exodeoxyribonuclease VII small subunit [Deinococcus alpinitundrae]|uniref:exodeoxyribonuclease VII small subunit n=1 Tax=Deinococcus alpinitundrae TaxID=468913 RepID=UPI00137B3D5D|nr:exodeoxyribonuclease VII small subunit [Deinococcus alpinitundrae]